MVMSWSPHAFFYSTTHAQTEKVEYAYFERWQKCLRIVQNEVLFLLFSIFKISTCSWYDADSERSDS